MEKSEFENKINGLLKKVDSMSEMLKIEEVIKNVLVMFFFVVLNYNVFDFIEFVFEYIVDFGSKKGECVDYVVVINGEV